MTSAMTTSVHTPVSAQNGAPDDAQDIASPIHPAQSVSLPGPEGNFAAVAEPSLLMGVIGNCAFSALVDQRGRIVWCCLPRFDGDPVFNALLEPGGEGKATPGAFGIEIEDFHESRQWYEPNTAVLRTQLFDRTGQGLEITDFAPRFYSRSRFFRPMTLVRRIRPISGAPRIRVVLDVRYDWGRQVPSVTYGSNHLRFVGDNMTLRLNTDVSISHLQARQPFVLTREHNFLLGADESLEGGIADTARLFEQETALYWRKWSQRLPLQWQDAVIRAAITLKLSLFEDTGAIVAAMTTSIPEAPGSQRNWDYRFCWLRDAFFVVRALNSLSEVGTMEDYLHWLFNVVVQSRGGYIQPLFGIGLELQLPESVISHLSGYRGMGPVRVGNQAQEHFQHDVYGNVVLGAAQAFHDHRLLHRAGLAEFKRLEEVGEQAVRTYDKPDAGMWELRTRARVHTSSALMCWAACDRLGKIAVVLKQPERATYWQNHAAVMQARILRESWSEKRQAFAESFGGRDLDASVLLMIEVGFIEPKDPRFIATVDTLEKHLCDGPYMRRYEAPDDFGKPETAFNICTFWRIDALARIGRKQQAREILKPCWQPATM